MKKSLLTIMALCVAAGAMAFPKSIYVKKGDTYSRYNFGVAADMNFTDGGKKLAVTGYNEVIDLNDVDYITFDAPILDNALTPSAQKEKMIQIGEAINDRVNVKENADVLNMFHFFFDHVEMDNHWQCPPCEFEIPEEYWNVHTRGIMEAISMIARLNPAGGAALEKAAVDLYKAEDYLGVYTADYEKEVWKKTSDADYFEMRYTPPTGEKVTWSARLTPSTDYTQWDTKDANVRIPKTMEIVLKKDKVELGKLILTTTLQQNKQIDLAIDGTVGTVGLNFGVKVTNGGIDVHTGLTNKGEYFADIKQHIAGKNLVNYDTMYDDIRDSMHHHDEEGNCIDGDPETLIAHFIRANVSADVMHLLQVEGKVANPTRIYELIYDDEVVYENLMEYNGYLIYTSGPASLLSEDGTVLTDRWSDYPADFEEEANALNDYSDITFHYDGDKTIQGFLGFDVDVEESEWPSERQLVILNNNLIQVSSYQDFYAVEARDSRSGEWVYVPLSDLGLSEKDIIRPAMTYSCYCSVMPLLIFPDMTSFAFEDYFDEVSFKRLIDDYNDVIDTYFDITGQER